MINQLHVYLTGDRILLRRQTGWLWRREMEPLEPLRWNADDPATLTLPPTTRAFPRASLHVYLGAALCQLMTLKIPASGLGRGEAQVIALATLQHELGLPPGEWDCALDDAYPAGKSPACAMRRSLLDRLRAAATQGGYQLVSVRPLAACLWNIAREQPGWHDAASKALLSIEDDAFSVLVEHAGVLSSVLTLPHNGEPGLVERELRRIGYSVEGDMPVNARLALCNDRLNLLCRPQQRLSLTPGGGALFADFRDLFFDAAEDA